MAATPPHLVLSPFLSISLTFPFLLSSLSSSFLQYSIIAAPLHLVLSPLFFFFFSCKPFSHPLSVALPCSTDCKVDWWWSGGGSREIGEARILKGWE
ncbi:unnamed protein product [Coffea canephora]|uniref:DH200=94 genomic scaffold, scaffold_371 n=1 Tax=Coffea canephora TaxID=49390 RepID=A0A068VF83_COFCA|nr:unnamed protein product [Coffea canephora]